MTPDDQTYLRVDLEEVAPGEFFIAVRWRHRKIAGLYLRGDQKYASEFLEVARHRILLVITDDKPDGMRGQVLQELARLSEDARLPRK